MTTTIPDIVVQSTSYTDVYSSSGVSVGTSVILQNKGSLSIFLQTGETIPSASSEEGVILSSLEMFIVDEGEAGLFARSFFGSCKLSIQPV